MISEIIVSGHSLAQLELIPHTAQMPSKDGKIRVLAIHGGGIRGVIPAHVLSFIEEVTNTPIWKLFDLICGTSTGGILGAALVKPSPLSASAAKELYVRRGKEIFSRSSWHVIKTLNGKNGPKFDGSGLSRVLREELGQSTMTDALTPFFMPAYDIENRAVKFFKSWEGADASKIPMWQACRATSAGPTYFPPGEINGKYYVDGGTINNNPALSGVIEACMHLGVHTKDALVVSLGTGLSEEPIKNVDAKDWGPLGWAYPLIGVFTDGVSALTDYQMKDLMRDDNFFHFQTVLQPKNAAMDNANYSNILDLIRSAEDLVVQNRETLINLAIRLKG